MAKVNIPKDTTITKDMLTIKRPGVGIKPNYINMIISKKSNTNVKKDELIKWSHIK